MYSNSNIHCVAQGRYSFQVYFVVKIDDHLIVLLIHFLAWCVCVCGGGGGEESWDKVFVVS